MIRAVIIICIFYLNLESLKAQSYINYHTGNKRDAITSPFGGVVMMGGSRESDEAMKWFLEQANKGDILVLRASGSDGYNEYLFDRLGIDVNSVESIVLKNISATRESYIQDKISKAEGIWFAGGNQWNYVKYFRDSPLLPLLRDAIEDRNIVIGGTSAGMAILGGYYFSARNGTVQSEEALTKPFSEKVMIEYRPFLRLPYLKYVVTDTHYSQRDRQGRHIVFMARGLNDTRQFINGIACDESTSVVIETSGKVKVYTSDGKTGNAFFIQPNCQNRKPYPEIMNDHEAFSWYKSYTALKVYKIPGDTSGSGWFDLNDWKSGSGGVWEDWSVNEGRMTIKPSDKPTCQALVLSQKGN